MPVNPFVVKVAQAGDSGKRFIIIEARQATTSPIDLPSTTRGLFHTEPSSSNKFLPMGTSTNDGSAVTMAPTKFLSLPFSTSTTEGTAITMAPTTLLSFHFSTSTIAGTAITVAPTTLLSSPFATSTNDGSAISVTPSALTSTSSISISSLTIGSTIADTSVSSPTMAASSIAVTSPANSTSSSSSAHAPNYSNQTSMGVAAAGSILGIAIFGILFLCARRARRMRGRQYKRTDGSTPARWIAKVTRPTGSRESSDILANDDESPARVPSESLTTQTLSTHAMSRNESTPRHSETLIPEQEEPDSALHGRSETRGIAIVPKASTNAPKGTPSLCSTTPPRPSILKRPPPPQNAHLSLRTRLSPSRSSFFLSSSITPPSSPSSTASSSPSYTAPSLPSYTPNWVTPKPYSDKKVRFGEDQIKEFGNTPVSSRGGSWISDDDCAELGTMVSLQDWMDGRRKEAWRQARENNYESHKKPVTMEREARKAKKAKKEGETESPFADCFEVL